MGGKRKVLVVDDEAVIVDAADRMLGAEGFAVLTAADAEQALQLLQSDIPDIALVDLLLPGLSGLEFFHLAKKAHPDIVMIMMTGFSTLDNVTMFLKGGALDFLPKPFTFEELLGAVQRASRFLDLRAAKLSNERGAAAPQLYRLGIGSWAKADPDGTVRLGITETFKKIVGPIERIELPSVNGEVYQGGLLAQLLAKDELKHSVWSALSGRVLSVNPEGYDNFAPLAADPWSAAWLVRIAPSNLENEVLNLSLL